MELLFYFEKRAQLAHCQTVVLDQTLQQREQYPIRHKNDELKSVAPHKRAQLA